VYPLTDIHGLIAPFYSSLEVIGVFAPVEVAEMPAVYGRMLSHNNHMTVTVERQHQSLVKVRVLAKHVTDSHYARKIVLARQSDGVVVQFGIMRVDLRALTPEVRREIEGEDIPLGRSLIAHGVLRDVELAQLWRITPAQELQQLLNMRPDETTFGRSALIHVSGQPAIELLEIVAPVSE